MKRAAILLALFWSIAAAAQASPVQHKGIIDNGPVDLSNQSGEQLQNTIKDFVALGVKWVRLDFDWSEMQPLPNVYNTAGHDRAIRALRDAGIAVLGLIAYAPGWAHPGERSKFSPPRSVGDYAKFARYLAARYAPLGVHAWEIWNEENIGQFWKPAPSAAGYVGLLRGAYPEIHAADPQATVLLGGLAQPGNTPTSISAIDFLRAVYAEGARPFFDAVADHPYNSPRLPADPSPSNNWQRMFATVPSLRGIMAQNGDATKQIWVTEYGAPTGGVDPLDQTSVLTPARQAEMVAEAYALIRTYPWAGPMFWYEYQDLCPAAAGKSSECYFGLRGVDGAHKPAYEAYREAPQ